MCSNIKICLLIIERKLKIKKLLTKLTKIYNIEKFIITRKMSMK